MPLVTLFGTVIDCLTNLAIMGGLLMVVLTERAAGGRDGSANP